jgi:hypothetical protein
MPKQFQDVFSRAGTPGRVEIFEKVYREFMVVNIHANQAA